MTTLNELLSMSESRRAEVLGGLSSRALRTIVLEVVDREQAWKGHVREAVTQALRNEQFAWTQANSTTSEAVTVAVRSSRQQQSQVMQASAQSRLVAAQGIDYGTPSLTSFDPLD